MLLSRFFGDACGLLQFLVSISFSASVLAFLNCQTPKPNAEEFAHFLGDIFASDTGFNSDELKTLLEQTSANGLPGVEPVTRSLEGNETEQMR